MSVLNDADDFRRMRRELEEARADIKVLQAALAILAAEGAGAAPCTRGALGAFAVRVLGFAESAGKGMGRYGRPAEVSRAAERMVSWAENYLPQKIKRAG